MIASLVLDKKKTGVVAYAEFINESAKKEPGWFDFAGKVLIAGMAMDLSVDKMTEYLLESYHGFALEEVNGTYEEVKRDMKEYFENVEIKLQAETLATLEREG